MLRTTRSLRLAGLVSWGARPCLWLAIGILLDTALACQPVSAPPPSDPTASSDAPLPPPAAAGVPVALLADGRLLAVGADGTPLGTASLTPPPPAEADRSVGHYLAVTAAGTSVYALVPGQPLGPDRLAILDVGTAQVRAVFDLPGATYRSLAVGPRTGSVYLFGNRDGGALVSVAEPQSGSMLHTWTARAAAGRTWRVYQGAVSADERRLFLSYHGPDTNGVDWFDLTDAGLRRCPAAARPNSGCLGGHGAFSLTQDGVLVTTGDTVLLDVDLAGRVRQGFDTGLEGNHLMEFAADATLQRVYAVGSCGYAGSFSAVSLRGGGTLDLSVTPRPWAWQTTPALPEVLYGAGVCGERIVLGPGGLLTVVQTQRPVPQPGRPGALLLVDPATGAVVRTIPTPSEPLDVVVVPGTRPPRRP